VIDRGITVLEENADPRELVYFRIRPFGEIVDHTALAAALGNDTW
jgi:hypothetical protein